MRHKRRKRFGDIQCHIPSVLNRGTNVQSTLLQFQKEIVSTRFICDDNNRVPCVQDGRDKVAKRIQVRRLIRIKASFVNIVMSFPALGWPIVGATTTATPNAGELRQKALPDSAAYETRVLINGV